MKYLNRSFSLAMPGNKAHWPWDEGNRTEDPSAANTTLSPEEWDRITKTLIEACKALEAARASGETFTLTQEEYRRITKHVDYVDEQLKGREAAEPSHDGCPICHPEEADAIKDHGGEA